MGEFESGLGQCDLSLPDDEGQHLFIAQVSVGLRAKLEQLPNNHPQGPRRKNGCRGGERLSITNLLDFCYVMILLQHLVYTEL